MTTNHPDRHDRPDPTHPPAEPAPSLHPVEELQALCDAATPPPWEVYDSNEGTWPPRPGWSVANEAFHNPPADEDAPWISVDVYVGTKADADFIAAARTALPALLARLRAAEETLAAVGALAEGWRAYQQTGFYPEASAHANAIENCGDALADLLADRAALAEGASR